MLKLIENILINIVNRSITLSKKTDFVLDFLSENIKATGGADRSAGADRISQSATDQYSPRATCSRYHDILPVRTPPSRYISILDPLALAEERFLAACGG